MSELRDPRRHWIGPSELRFDDWLDRELDDRSELLTVANWSTEEVHGASRAKFATLSALTQVDHVEEVLKDLNWDVQANSFDPRFYEEGGRIVYERGERAESRGGRWFWPLIRYRWYHDLATAYCEVIDEFVDYHELAPDVAGWVQPLSGRLVVHRVAPTHLKVRRDALVDYLAARDLALVRFHDHFRWKCSSEVPVRQEADIRFTNARFKFITDAEPGRMFKCDEGQCWLGMAWGKDILRPAPEPQHRFYLFEKDRIQPQELPEYIVAEDGSTMRPVAHYGDAESPFLTPVFFKPEVLNRYLSDSRAFEVDGYYIRDNGGIWGLEYGRTTTGAVVVWLGDLAQSLPSTEHKYWKPYNVAPSGRMRDDFLKPQILGEWTESLDAAVRVRSARREANDVTSARFKAELFREPAAEQNHILSTLHVPLSNDRREFAQQVEQLALLIVDAMNADLLRRLLPDLRLGIDAKGNRLRSLKLLHVVLVQVYQVAEPEADAIVRPLFAIQDLRSKLGAHVTSSAAIRESLQQAGVDPGTEPIRMFEKLAMDVASSIRAVAKALTR